ncbi:3980_t:CDS:1 [Funneliformis mosseae]|uniref:3980_t:CDS:1 n=1 Tax=Funneliformis mosseae TaxID=27381 RepID=A0A9N9CU25_FUNMO|nr:3980_t:CDS:1 [Funneliformis mosseae]
MECSLCKKPTNSCCSRCKARYYCSKECQKKDYVNHVLDCPPRSADDLVKSAYADLVPTKPAVLHEYGFNNCKNPREKSMLLGLYIGLIKIIGCSASQIHSWWENGELSLGIKKAYNDAGVTSGYYQWFLENENLLQGLHKYEGEKSDKTLMDKYYTMVKPYLSVHDQSLSFESFSESKRNVIVLYLITLIGCIPRVEQQCWIDFGFSSCKVGKDHLEEEEEIRLSKLYRKLIVQEGCKVDEFNDAYVSGTVVDLLKRKCGSCSWLSENKIEIQAHQQPKKSVYYLKQYVLSESVGLQNSVWADYGFMNCRTENETRQLKQMYKKLIKTPQFDPRDLHKACLAGKIFNYVRSILPNEELKADLLRNLYPLK